MEGSSIPTDFHVYYGKLQNAGVLSTRKAAGLPADVAFHRSMDQGFAHGLDLFSERVLAVTNRLLTLVSTTDQTSQKKGKGGLEGQDDVVDHFHSLVVDPMDQLLEKTDICLDTFLGKNKAPAIAINPPITSNKKTASKPLSDKQRIEPVVQHAAHLVKPQNRFTRNPDNSDALWYPALSHKYNAKVPLGHIYTEVGTESSTGIIANHPYRHEITHISYPSHIFESCTPVLPPPLEDTQATCVATPEDLQKMLVKLKNAKEIAVDLEHHSYRSYSGFLCLMQISDRDEDWVVDLLAIRDEVEALNEVFTDPNIVKVFHGAESDIVWLQQDLNIYIVGLFDTFHASKLLEFPRHGLANLLEMYCDFIPDKRYQLADWRIRPLPEDMLRYARSDTHFLLYIYDNLRNALLDRSESQRSRSPSLTLSSTTKPARELLNQALARSAETSLRVYSKETYDADEGSGSGGWDTLAKKWNKGALVAGGPGVGIGALHREVYKSVHGWRERVAREEDESTRYVLQNHVLFAIAEQPPADMAALLAIFKSSVPPLVKKRAKELLAVVREATTRGLGPNRVEGKTEDQASSAVVTQAQTQASERRKDVIMLDSEIKKLERVNGLHDVANIWGQGTNLTTTSTSQSSLLGSGKLASKPITYSTTVSSLFGGSRPRSLTSNANIKSTSIGSMASTSSRAHSQDLIAKINRSFTMAPSVPKITSSTSTGPAATAEDKFDNATGMEVGIPYVPAARRPTKQIKEEIDTIIVVGQARQKRKRKVAEGKERETSTPDISTPSSRISPEKEGKASRTSEVVEAFDFAAVPNILDDNPDTEERKKKRQRKQKNNGGTFYGDFPAPPKAYSELKSGNQSHTFK